MTVGLGNPVIQEGVTNCQKLERYPNKLQEGCLLLQGSLLPATNQINVQARRGCLIVLNSWGTANLEIV